MPVTDRSGQPEGERRRDTLALPGSIHDGEKSQTSELSVMCCDIKYTFAETDRERETKRYFAWLGTWGGPGIRPPDCPALGLICVAVTENSCMYLQNAEMGIDDETLTRQVNSVALSLSLSLVRSLHLPTTPEHSTDGRGRGGSGWLAARGKSSRARDTHAHTQTHTHTHRERERETEREKVASASVCLCMYLQDETEERRDGGLPALS